MQHSRKIYNLFASALETCRKATVYVYFVYVKMSKTVAIFYQKEQKFSMVSSIISAMYCYRSLYMNQIPGIYYLYARLIKQDFIRIPLLYSKRIDCGIKNQ